MKKLFYAGFALLLYLHSCTSEQNFPDQQTFGNLVLKPTVDLNVEQTSRATSTDLSDYYVILDDGSFVQSYPYPESGILENIVSGNYNVIITSHEQGFTVPAFDVQYYRGEQQAVIKNGQNTSVNITVTQANAGVFFIYDQSLAAAGLDEVVPLIGQGSAILSYEGSNRELTGYFPPSEYQVQIMQNGDAVSISGSSAMNLTLEARQLWKITLRAGSQNGEITIIADIDLATDDQFIDLELDNNGVFGNIPAGDFRDMLVLQGLVKLIDEQTGRVEIMPELEAYTIVNFMEQPFSDISGIEYFINIEQIILNNMPNLERVNLSANKKLKSVSARTMGVNFTEMVLGELPELTEITVTASQLPALDISALFKIETISVSNTKIEEVDLTNLSLLRNLTLSNSQLTSLDISHNPLLIALDCSNNKNLAYLDLSGCSQLSELNCWGTSITELNITGCTGLTKIDMDGNKVQHLDLRGLTELSVLKLGQCELTEIDLSDCTKLTEFKLQNNKLRNVDISMCKGLKQIWLYGNPLEEINISNLNEVNTFWLFGYGNLKSGSMLDLSASSPNMTELHTIVADNLSSYTTVNLINNSIEVGFTALRNLSLRGCPNLTTIKIHNCPSLENLYLNGSDQAVNFDFSGSENITVNRDI